MKVKPLEAFKLGLLIYQDVYITRDIVVMSICALLSISQILSPMIPLTSGAIGWLLGSLIHTIRDVKFSIKEIEELAEEEVRELLEERAKDFKNDTTND